MLKRKIATKKNKETVGNAARGLLLKKPYERNPNLITEEMLKDYESNLFACIDRALKVHFKDFYIVVLTKKERIMPNVLRNYFFFRSSCPTPEYDQTVYKFKFENKEIEYMWTIPAKDICIYLYNNATLVDQKEAPLLEFVVKFIRGDLDKIAKRLNKEQAGSNLLEGKSIKGDVWKKK